MILTNLSRNIVFNILMATVVCIYFKYFYTSISIRVH